MQAPAPHRVGEPSPLIFHLTAALTAYSQALLAAPRADSPSFPWADSLRAEAAELGGDLDRVALAREIAARLKATVDGLELWQEHPYRRRLPDPPALWSDGCSRLLDYGAASEAADPAGPPLLVVPSLINRAYVLDLSPGHSMLRWLAAQGLRPLLVDWGEPGPAESGFDLDAYGSRRLLPATPRVEAKSHGAPMVTRPETSSGRRAASPTASVPPMQYPSTGTGPPASPRAAASAGSSRSVP